MYYIYCYTNKINQHKYVGQTNNLQRRIKEHRSCSFNSKASSHNDLIHRKIREYGEENFDIEVLETLYVNDIAEVHNREKHWIKELNTFCGNGCGYNQDHGGSTYRQNSRFNEEQIIEIKNKIKQGISYYDLEREYQVSSSFLSSINHGAYFFDDRETYPLYRYYKDDSDYDELIELLTNSTLSIREIARTLNMGLSTVTKINQGQMRKGLYPSYPIRKESVNKVRADKIKELLLNTNISKTQIGEMTGASMETVRRVNIGKVFHDKKLQYPLRPL